MRYFVTGSATFGASDVDWPLYLEAAGWNAVFARAADGTWVMFPAQEIAWPSAQAAIDSSTDTSVSLGGEKASGQLVQLNAQIPPANGVKRFQSTDAQFDLPLFGCGYDWELFFHIPIIVAKGLATNQRFADALQWLSLVFDPTLPAKPAVKMPSGLVIVPATPAWWRFLPFAQAGQGTDIDTLLAAYSAHQLDSQAMASFTAQIAYWRKQPFQPHGVARMRIRAYEWRTVFDYLDVLIAWGDQQFKQDTIESINQATQLYLLAWEILGRRPTAMPEQPMLGPTPTYALYELRWDDFSNAWISLGDLPVVRSRLPAKRQHRSVHKQVGPTFAQL